MKMLRRFGAAVSVLLGVALLPLVGGAPASAAIPTTASVATPYLASVAMASTPDGGGYWLVGLDGGVFSFGDAGFHGSLPGLGISVHDIVGIASTADGQGYWLLGADGGVFSFGDATFYGSLPGVLGRAAPNPMTSIVRTPDGGGYWIVGTDGGVFTFGDAGFYGSLPGINVTPSSARVADSVTFHAYASSEEVFLAPTPDAGGYWVVDSAGDVYGFGDAGFYGSLPGRLSSLAKSSAHDVVTGHQASIPVTGFAPTADGHGYWMVATDGSLYTFGDAANYGSLPALGLTPPSVTVNGYIPPSTVGLSIPLANISSLVRTPDGGGYWFTSLNGGVFSFGDAQFHGSVPGVPSSIDSVGELAGS
ncbi:MAG TPA: hypothetical protein VNG12_01680 [Acidimicrobiales bacterium]|nr:hypothetical protein [Acidimicrobiales bacterium]